MVALFVASLFCCCFCSAVFWLADGSHYSGFSVDEYGFFEAPQ